MKIKILSLFLFIILFSSACSTEKTLMDAEPEEYDPTEDYDEDYDETYDDDSNIDSEDVVDQDYDVGSDESTTGSEEITWEDVYPETQCDGGEAIDLIFDLVEQSATNEEIFQAMCDIDCEELNPEEQQDCLF